MLLAVVVLAIAVGVALGGHHGRAGAKVAAPAVPHVTALDPQRFAAGACESMPPTRGDRHLTVFLDAGHGGIDPGGTGTTESGNAIREADITLPVELDAATMLRGQGFTVVVSRTGDSTVARLPASDVAAGALSLQGSHDDVAARDVCANLGRAAALVGIYMDAGASPSNAGSVTGYDTARPFSAANQHLAELVQTDVLVAMNSHGWAIPDEGVLPDSGLGSIAPLGSATSGLAAAAASYQHLLLLGPAQPGYFTTPSLMPGALIEPLFLTDPFEGSLAASPAGQQVIAGGVAAAIEQYFPLPVPAPTATSRG